MSEKRIIGVIKPEDVPSNSLNKKKDLEPKKVEKVISGQVIKKKQSFGSKMAEVFIGEDGKSVVDYVLYDVVVPAVKNTISDVIVSSIEMMFWGRTSGGHRKPYSSSGYNTPYGTMSTRGTSQPPRREYGYSQRATHDVNSIIIASRDEANEVLSRLSDLIADYGVATVSDLYSMVDITPEWTDVKYGWKSIGGARADRVREGYLLNLPKPIYLD